MTQFTQMDLKPEIQKSLQEIGFEKPTPIQEKIIPLILKSGQDTIGLAQTGTGKTAAFGIPVLQKINANDSRTQALIMAPTRELTLQISTDLKEFAKHLDHIKIVAAYGGARIDMQIRELKRGAQIIVATPGRLLDLIRRKKISLSSIDILVLDEADEMLNFGFKEEIDTILEQAPKEKTTLLFSATMSKGVAKIANNYMVNPVEISVGKKNTGADNIDYQFFVVKAKNRYASMKRIIDINPDIYSIIFCRTRQETKDVAEHLIRDGFDADAIHGDLSQSQRDQVMKRFKNKSLKLLVATDVASRGIDVKDITHVINYNLPDEVEVYTHRSGRTGRAGKKGVAIAIIHAKEVRRLQRIQKTVGREFSYQKVPGLKQILNLRLENYTTSILNHKDSKKVPTSSVQQAVTALEEITKEELIKILLDVQLSPLATKLKENEELNIPFQGLSQLQNQSERSSDNKRGRSKRTKEREIKKDAPEKPKKVAPRKENKTPRQNVATLKVTKKADKKEASKSKINHAAKNRFFINSGTKFGLSEESLNEFIKVETKSKVSGIQSIEIMKKFTFFEVNDSKSEALLSSLKNKKLHGREVSVQVAIPPK